MTITKLTDAFPRAESIKAVVAVALAIGGLELVRVVVFRTLLLDQPVAKVAAVAMCCALLVKFIQRVHQHYVPVGLLKAVGLVNAFAGAFIGYLPLVMVAGRPAFASTSAIEVVSIAIGALAGFVCFVSLSRRAWF